MFLLWASKEKTETVIIPCSAWAAGQLQAVSCAGQTVELQPAYSSGLLTALPAMFSSGCFQQQDFVL